ncbi:PREDICTED: oncoprotein-induced transcript 3 protein-like, partial [Amphimedon queenslandica]|uniref:EGF-like domain-containing protein n=1 Tax=Amphimedon queenslandica TaxID=400682 RepID=A0AAN0ISE8_AMPQE
INECDTNNGGCEQDCINTIGSYQCQCREGFQFTRNGRSCADIDECADKNGGCEQICNNTLGSFQCSCLIGFTLTNDAFCSGKNINECALVDNRCSHDCVNTPGSYHCTCKDGYYLSNDSHTCLVCNLEEVLKSRTICKGLVTIATSPTNIGAIENTSSSSLMVLAISSGFIIIIVIIGIASCVVIVLLIVVIYKRKKKQPHHEEQAHDNPMFHRGDEIKDIPANKKMFRSTTSRLRYSRVTEDEDGLEDAAADPRDDCKYNLFCRILF